MPIILLLVAALSTMIVATWAIYTKAGEAGWKCLIPIYNGVVYMRITGRPWWWLLLLLVPVVNLIPAIVTCFDLARVFGKGKGFGLGLLLISPVFMCMLGFGGARYRSPKTPATPAQPLTAKAA